MLPRQLGSAMLRLAFVASGLWAAEDGDFARPPASFRPVPFWAWNARLEERELESQLADFAAKGFGGAFVHARTGLQTPYLSPRWFELVRTASGAARRLGLSLWIYDDDRWPSGAAGGLATRDRPEFRGARLQFETLPPDEGARALAMPDTVSVFAVEGDTFRRLDGAHPPAGGVLLRFHVVPFAADSRFNGAAYLDVLNPAAVGHFLDLTFGRGYDRVRQAGCDFAGVFTDEPGFAPQRGGARGGLPWTPRLFEAFRRERGYDLRERLPLLALPLAGYEQLRYDFWRTVTELFESAFTRPYAERTRLAGWTFTGHFLHEESLGRQTDSAGSVMVQHFHQSMPGVDHLGLDVGGAVAKKQASSVAHQFGRQRVLAELWGSSGHVATFEDLKWIADYHFALGVNFVCPHHSLYSIAGDRKRDYPPTLSRHEPYWPHLATLNDYLGRASYFTTRGRPENDLLVVVPLGSAWSLRHPTVPSPELERVERGFQRVVRELLGKHRPFDLGDEILIERFGAVDEGRLRVGPAGRYRTVLLPASTRWGRPLLDLLEEFVRGGGNLVLVEPQPDVSTFRIAGHPALRVITAPEQLDAILEEIGPRPLSVVDSAGREIAEVLVQHRVGAAAEHYYFLANTSRDRAVLAELRTPRASLFEEWDLRTGKVRRPLGTRIELPAAGSLALVTRPARNSDGVQAPAPQRDRPRREMEIAGPFRFRRSDPAVLLIDRCRYSLAKDLGEPVPLAAVRRVVLAAAGLSTSEGYQPWALAGGSVHGVDLLLECEFESTVELSSASLVVEGARDYRVTFEGRLLESKGRWLSEPEMNLLPLGPVPRGLHRIRLAARYRPGMAIENLVLLGDFAVRRGEGNRYLLGPEPPLLAAGSWTDQGYPFYVGSMTYEIPIECGPLERAELRLSDPRGSVFVAQVPGSAPQVLPWRPWTVELPPGSGGRSLDLTVVSSLQNALGPLHSEQYRRPRSQWRAGPAAFEEELARNDHRFEPYGLGKMTLLCYD